MRIVAFGAEPDLIGQRIRVGWIFLLEEAETLPDIPIVRLRRKTGDFAFPPAPASPVDDPRLVFDSDLFTTIGGSGDDQPLVVELPGWELPVTAQGARTIVTVESVSRPSAAESTRAQRFEVLRQTTATTYGGDGLPTRRRVEILDNGFPLTGVFLPDNAALVPGMTYYYRLDCRLGGAPLPEALTRPLLTTATATRAYGLNRALYDLLPDIYRAHDTVRRPVWEGADAVPEASSGAGQLRRFFDLFGLPMDWARSLAENVRGLHDINNADYRYLPLLAETIGWALAPDADISLQRNEIKNAPRLYRQVGTIPAVRALTEHYTGWHTRIVEYGAQVARTNAPPDMHIFALDVTDPPGAPLATERRSVDDAALVLGFGLGNDLASGADGLPATIVGTQQGPFALRSGMALTIAADHGDPATVLFGPGDFVRIDAATAAEVARAVANALPNVEARAEPDGVVKLSTATRGRFSRLEVYPAWHRPVTVQGGPTGRSAIAIETSGRLRLLYVEREDVVKDDADRPPGARLGRLRIKTFTPGTAGGWANAELLPLPDASPPAPPAAFGVPAICALPAGTPMAAGEDSDRLWVAMIEGGRDGTRIVEMTGATSPQLPAVLAGQRRGPFNMSDKVTLSVASDGSASEQIVLQPADFVAPVTTVTAEAVAAKINEKTTPPKRFDASVALSGALLLTGKAVGPAGRLRLDLSGSRGLAAIGFGHPSQLGGATPEAVGTWDPSVTWEPATRISSIPQGRHRDLSAAVDGNGVLHLCWAQFSADSVSWQIYESTNAFDGSGWTDAEEISDSATAPAGSFQPFAARSRDGNLHLFWSRRDAGDDPENPTYSLRRRIFDVSARQWGDGPAQGLGEIELPIAGAAPSAIATAVAGEMRVFFTSTRNSEPGLWECVAAADGTATEPVIVLTGIAAASFPVPAAVDNAQWLFYGSDRSFSPLVPTSRGLLDGEVSSASRSQYVPLPATERRCAGTTTVQPANVRRNSARGAYDDVLAYTPQRPRGPAQDGPLLPEERYSLGTIGLFLGDGQRGEPLVAQNVTRLRQLLTEYLPLPMRAIVAVTPIDAQEFVYPEGGGLPSDAELVFVEYIAASPFADATAVTLPDTRIGRTTTLGDVTVDPNDLLTLRMRTVFLSPA